VIGTFSEQRPGVEVTVVEAESDTLLDDLRDGRLDAAILIGSSTSANVRSVLLQERRVNVAMSCHHRLAGHDRITATDLTDEVVAVSGQRGGATYDGIVCRLLDSLGLRHQLRPSGYGSALLAPVQAGSAIAFVPAHEVDGDPRITVRPLEPASMFRFELVWQAGVTSAVVDTFVETCTKTVAGRAERIPAARPAEFAGRRIAA
jgi:DNA-binding transcriptional LysR family regulator